jgi:hypothetical protein
VTGNPGIGKSRSMKYLLKLLLEAKETVVYESRNNISVFCFIPNKEDGNYQVFKCSLKYFDPFMPLLNDPNTFHLIDLSDHSPHIIESCARTIATASPRTYYENKEFKQSNQAERFLMPVWRKEEIIPLITKFSVENKKFLSLNEFEKRFEIFGGIIRYIFASKSRLSRFQNDIEAFIDDLSFTKMKQIAELSRIINVETSSSILFSYTIKNEEIGGYTYQNDNYNIEIGSEHISKMIILKFSEEIIDFLDPTGSFYQKSPNFCGKLFEVVLIHTFQQNGTLEAWGGQHFEELYLNEGKISKVGETWEKFNKECLKLGSWRDDSYKREILRPLLSNQPVLDLVDAYDRGYNFTMSEIHEIKLDSMKEILSDSRITKENPFVLYFVVPTKNFTKFKWTIKNDSLKGYKDNLKVMVTHVKEEEILQHLKNKRILN